MALARNSSDEAVCSHVYSGTEKKPPKKPMPTISRITGYAMPCDRNVPAPCKSFRLPENCVPYNTNTNALPQTVSPVAPRVTSQSFKSPLLSLAQVIEPDAMPMENSVSIRLNTAVLPCKWMRTKVGSWVVYTAPINQNHEMPMMAVNNSGCL